MFLCFLITSVLSCANSTELSIYGDSTTIQSYSGSGVECAHFNINFGDFGHSFYFTSNNNISYTYGHTCANENDTVIENNTKISFFHGSQHVELCVLRSKEDSTLRVISAVHPVNVFEIHNTIWIVLISVTSLLLIIQCFNVYAVKITITYNMPFIRYIKMKT